MSHHEPNPPNDPKKSALQFTIALAVVLGGVVVGYFMTRGHEGPRPANKPTALGHQRPPVVEPKPASALEKIPQGQGSTNGMVWIPGGKFWMGSPEGKPDEAPVHQVEVDGFWMDKTEVTNAEFAKFVDETGYVTVAERKPDPKDFPGADPAMLVAGSVVFAPPPGEIPLHNHYVWWRWVPGADWKHPQGPGTSIEGKEDHPVVHVAYEDALAYAKWAGKRLPTEAEWEYAARGGLDKAPFVWGDEKTPGGKWLANIWQGRFPNENTGLDGYPATAPVASFDPNGYGLHDMAGNIWEWCADWYRPDYYANSPLKNPPGPSDSYDPNEPDLAKRVTRGGSYLCSDLYCIGYRPSARMKTTPDTGLSHTGFRCVWTPARE